MLTLKDLSSMKISIRKVVLYLLHMYFKNTFREKPNFRLILFFLVILVLKELVSLKISGSFYYTITKLYKIIDEDFLYLLF